MTSPDQPFVAGLGQNRANFAPLSPVGFLRRAAEVYPAKAAVIHGERTFSYREFHERCRRLASVLAARGIGRGDTVAVIAPNVPALLESHYAVPGLGAVLNALNYRLDPATIAFCLEHGEARVLITDREFSPLIAAALKNVRREIFVVDIDDPLATGGHCLGAVDYESWLASGDPSFELKGPLDEWDSASLLYTSGTTGDPKGVLYHHRGAYLNSLGNALTFGLTPDSVYLWTLPMFHCNGWSYTWAVTAAGGTHVCLRKVDPALIFPAIAKHRVTHLCGAPIVLNMLVNAPESVKQRFEHRVEVATGGAAPPSAIIAAMEKMGFRVTHLYGLTESYGPATLCAWQDEWGALGLEERARLMARQGVRYATLEGLMVADESHVPVPKDGATMGEVMLRGNTIMKGYLRNPRATAEAFREGWYHTGDLAVWHPDGYIEVKDRSKDIIISGGENISSLEVEDCLYQHPDVLEAAVVARPDAKWGETPCAFVALKPGRGQVKPEDIVAWCRARLASFKVPRTVVFGELPKTSTGKIQKFLLRDRARSL